MAKIVRPEEVQIATGLRHTTQTNKQPVVMRCPNPQCFDKGKRWFDFVSDYPECPKCGLGPPAVQKRGLVHILIQSRKGPIAGDMGLRYYVLCSPRRDTLATLTNGEAMTGDPYAANCPGCIKKFNRQVGTGTVRQGVGIYMKKGTQKKG